MMHSAHFIFSYVALKYHSDSERKEVNVLFNDALNTFYFQLCGTEDVVKYHSDSERKEVNVFI